MKLEHINPEFVVERYGDPSFDRSMQLVKDLKIANARSKPKKRKKRNWLQKLKPRTIGPIEDKAPSMPKLEPEDGDIERHTAYTRLNPSGDKELVVGDDEETLNEIARSLQECAEEYIWDCVRNMLPADILEKPGVNEKIDNAIGRGAAPDEIVAMLRESVAFSGPLPTGGGAGSPEQLETDRRHNQFTPLMVSLDGDQERTAQDDLNNLTSTTAQVADGPERSRAKSRHRATARGNEFPIKNIAGYRGDGLDYGATHSEDFTGTGAIAIGPTGGYNVVDDEDDDDEDEIIENMNMEYQKNRSRTTATLWYVPADQPPSQQQVQQAIQLLGVNAQVRHRDEHPGEPPSTWVVGPEYGFVTLDLEQPLPDGTHLQGNGIEVVVEIAPDDPDDEEFEQNRRPMESIMSDKDLLTEEVNQVLTEWEPSFKSGEYDPGDYQMPCAPGDGVADKKPTKDKVGAYDTDTSNSGKEWPRDHNDTEAMGSVDDDGVDGDPAGTHESSVGEPTDGYQDKVGHDWPDEAKNTGSGVAEPFEGDRWSDGGVLKNSGQDEMTNSGVAQKLPSDGPITGTSGPQMGQPSESWTPEGIGSLMEGDLNLQDLFDSYARDHGRVVCLEDFQTLCNAHGCDALLDETSLIQLIEANNEFIFYQGEDANGYYWQPTSISEGVAGAVGGAALGAMAGGPAGAVVGGAGGSIAQDTLDDDGEDDDIDESVAIAEIAPLVAAAGRAAGRAALPVATKWASKKLGAGDDDADDAEMSESKTCSQCGCDPCECDDDCVEEGENRLPFGQNISERQIRSPRDEAQYATHDFAGESPEGMGPEDMYTGDPERGDIGGYDDMLGMSQSMDMQHGPGEFDDHGSPTDSCPECGEMTSPGEEACPGCGAPIDDQMGPMDMMAGGDEDLGGYAGANAAPAVRNAVFGGMSPGGGGRIGRPVAPGRSISPNLEATLVNSPEIMESFNNFMSAARRILEHNHDFHREHIAEALNYSWIYHARNTDPSKAPAKVQQTLQGLMQTFPGFRPVMEGGGDAMDKADGTAIGTGGGPGNSSDFLAAKDQPGPDEMKDEGEPLGKSQKNTYEETPEIKGTHKGMDGKGSVAQSVKENVARLSKHVQKELREGAKKNLRGKYTVGFSLMVNEDKRRNRTASRTRLSEALADAEELLQLHDADDVTLETTFTDKSGTIALKQDIPLFTIKPRGLMVSEGMAIFRFKRTAEDFANELVAEGATCRVVTHNWGRAVETKVSRTLAESAFRTLTGRR